jgi:hypothetical protein
MFYFSQVECSVTYLYNLIGRELNRGFIQCNIPGHGQEGKGYHSQRHEKMWQIDQEHHPSLYELLIYLLGKVKTVCGALSGHDRSGDGWMPRPTTKRYLHLLCSANFAKSLSLTSPSGAKKCHTFLSSKRESYWIQKMWPDRFKFFRWRQSKERADVTSLPKDPDQHQPELKRLLQKFPVYCQLTCLHACCISSRAPH